MSIPWAWLGSGFPTCEDGCDASTTGNGTGRPVLWANSPDGSGTGAPGSTAASEIVPFEWTTAQLTWTLAGTLTATFQNPSFPDDPSHYVVASADFSLTWAANATAYSGGTPGDWSVLEPSDYFVGGQNFSVGTFTGPSINFTLPWGTETVTAALDINVQNLYAINGSDFAQYTKDAEVTAYFSGGHWVGTLILSTNQNSTFISTGLNPFPNDLGPMTFFHASPHIYMATNDPNGAITLSTCSVAVTQKFTQPPDIA